MATSRSLAGLNDTNLVQFIKEKKKKQTDRASKTVRCLVTSINHYFFVWEPEECCLVVKNLLDVDSSWTGRKQTNVTSHDRFLKISVTDVPFFDVESIEANLDGSLVLLTGPQGVAFVELPGNWTSLEANSIKSEKIARSAYVDEELLTCNSKIRIQQARFHPGSPTNSHVMILTSDNCIRIYDVLSPHRAEKTIPIGCRMQRSSIANTTFNTFTDDVAVSFDFGRPFEDRVVGLGGTSSSLPEGVPVFKFPVYVLYGNGNVYSFYSSVQSNSSRAPKTVVYGPLTMLPAAEDNYGADACSLLCLAVSPAVLVIANQQGNIHHAVVLPRESDLDERGDEPLGKSHLADDLESLLSWASLAPTNMCSTESVLYVTETLELDGDILDDSDSGLSPLPQSSENEGTIHLVKDPSCTARYFITHDYGVHAVAVPLVTKLSQLAAKDDEEVSSDDVQQAMLEESVVEFILCSRTKSSALAPPQGIVLYRPQSSPLPPTLLVLLDSGDIQSICLSRLLKPAVKLFTDDDTKTNQTVTRESFEMHIRQQLQRTHSQPKLSLPPGTELPVAEIIKLFSRSVQTLREEYIMKQDVVREELEKRSRLLELHLQQQFDELDLVQQSKADLINKAHQLAEKYEDAVESQEKFVNRVEKVLFEIQRRSPVLTDAEKQMGQQLRQLQSKLDTLKRSMESLRRKEQLCAKVAQVSTSSPTMNHLNKDQRAVLHEMLTKQGDEIAALLKGIQQVKKKMAA